MIDERLVYTTDGKTYRWKDRTFDTLADVEQAFAQYVQAAEARAGRKITKREIMGGQLSRPDSRSARVRIEQDATFKVVPEISPDVESSNPWTRAIARGEPQALDGQRRAPETREQRYHRLEREFDEKAEREKLAAEQSAKLDTPARRKAIEALETLESLVFWDPGADMAEIRHLENTGRMLREGGRMDIAREMLDKAKELAAAREDRRIAAVDQQVEQLRGVRARILAKDEPTPAPTPAQYQRGQKYIAMSMRGELTEEEVELNNDQFLSVLVAKENEAAQ